MGSCVLRNFIFDTDICTYIHTYEVNFTSDYIEYLYATVETKISKHLYVYSTNTVCTVCTYDKDF